MMRIMYLFFQQESEIENTLNYDLNEEFGNDLFL